VFARYTEKARRTIHFAKWEADELGSPEISSEHILLALLRDPVLVSHIMDRVSEKEIREAILVHLPRGEPIPLPHDLPLNRDSRKALLLAVEEADRLSDPYIRNGHILLGLLRLKNSYTPQLLNQKGVLLDKIRDQITKLAPDDVDQEYRPAAKQSPVESQLQLQIRKTIRQVGELTRRGKGRNALQLLADFMAEPGQDRKFRMRFLGQFAAITALQVGELETARRYCEVILADNPDDPMALFQLADCLARQGETDKARQHAAKCYQLGLAQGGELGRGLLELLEKRFPGLKPSS
jgi:tetratricopeptide (TPR) repeat protein